MRERLLAIIFCLLAPASALCAPPPRQHALNFGPWMPVELFLGPGAGEVMNIQVRPLYIDGTLKEFTTGELHELGGGQFVVRRAFRLNDRLPQGKRKPPRFRWQRGVWLLVDRTEGRITQLRLPAFDPFYSAVAWHGDYAAYCGLSDDGEKVYAVVTQLAGKRPLVYQQLGAAHGGSRPESECALPQWRQQPLRVTFQPLGAAERTFAVAGEDADPAAGSDTAGRVPAGP
jgi:hypothetical protein